MWVRVRAKLSERNVELQVFGQIWRTFAIYRFEGKQGEAICIQFKGDDMTQFVRGDGDGIITAKGIND